MLIEDKRGRDLRTKVLIIISWIDTSYSTNYPDMIPRKQQFL